MAANRLQQILAVKAREVARLLPRAEILRAAALLRNDVRPFALALDRGPEALGLIAEVKNCSSVSTETHCAPAASYCSAIATGSKSAPASRFRRTSMLRLNAAVTPSASS